MRAARLGAGAGERLAAERLHADYSADHAAVHVDVTRAGATCDALGAAVDTRVHAEGERIAERVDALDQRLHIAGPAHDLQHRAEDFFIGLGYVVDLVNARRDVGA